MGKKYLYGASIHGIQEYIFRTNKLKDIVTASSLVNEICTSVFDRFTIEKSADMPADNKNSILRAAGNIKYLFDTKEACEKAVLEFPRVVMRLAPGITISQAVVEIEEKLVNEESHTLYDKALQTLEERLSKQRNKPVRSQTLGLMGVSRSSQTGLPVVERVKSKVKTVKTKTNSLYSNFFGEAYTEFDIETDLDKMSDKNDWLAVIHADGNSLGQVVRDISSSSAAPDNLKRFSEQLNAATIEAANAALKFILPTSDSCAEKKISSILPIVLGGDDVTVICRADLALDFTHKFLEEFEKNTHEKLKDIAGFMKDNSEVNKKLTACAGIAYIKSSYPFYYAYSLAESLCGRAKKYAKEEVAQNNELAPSCLKFHKVQDSFVENYDVIIERELTPCTSVSFENGPYYLNDENNEDQKEKKNSITKLIKDMRQLSTEEGNAVKNGLREWVQLLYTNEGMARQKIYSTLGLLSGNSNKELKDLVVSVTPKESKESDAPKPAFKSAAYDLLSLHSVVTQQTKSKQ